MSTLLTDLVDESAEMGTIVLSTVSASASPSALPKKGGIAGIYFSDAFRND